MQRMKKKLKDELDEKNTVQEYICPNCGKRSELLPSPPSPFLLILQVRKCEFIFYS